MARFVMKMPDVGEGTVEAEIVEWHVQPGAMVAEEQPIVDVMTNKATVEITAPVAGVVVAVQGVPGDRLAVGAPLIEFETERAATSATAPASRAPARAVVADLPAQRVEQPPAHPGYSELAAPARVTERAAPSGMRKMPLAAPTVRRRASEALVDLADVPATGPGGRITHDDLDRYLAGVRPASAQPPANSVTAGGAATLVSPRKPESISSGDSTVRIIGHRRAIAEKMAISKRRIPHYTYVEEVDVTELQGLLEHLNAERGSDRPKLSFVPFIMKAMAKAVTRLPHCNAHFDDESGTLTQYAAVHIGVATNTPGGLRVPVVRDVQSCSITRLASDVTRLAAAARDGTIAPRELTGSTITITSLGKLGGIVATPIINHPEVAIVGVNRAMERAVVKHGAVVARTMMNLSASFDHRIVDGYDGATLVRSIKSFLELPATLFMDAEP